MRAQLCYSFFVFLASIIQTSSGNTAGTPNKDPHSPFVITSCNFTAIDRVHALYVFTQTIVDGMAFETSVTRFGLVTVKRRPARTCRIRQRHMDQLLWLIILGGDVELNPGPQPEFKCEVCDKMFTFQTNLSRHIKSHSTAQQVTCPLCSKTFSRKDNMHVHLTTCGVKTSERRIKKMGQPSTKNLDLHSFKRKQKRTHKTLIYDLPPPDGEFESVQMEFVDSDSGLLQVYRENWHNIRTSYTRSRSGVIKWYNFRMGEPDMKDIKKWLRAVFERQKSSFLMNVEFGFMLLNSTQLHNEDRNDLPGSPSEQLTEHSEDEPFFRHYYNSDNTKFFDEAKQITKKSDLQQKVLRKLYSADLVEWATNKRPNSKWVFQQFTNITVKIIQNTDYPIWGTSANLPRYIRKNKNVVGLEINGRTGRKYKDNYCVFRCLALHLGESVKSLEKVTKRFTKQWAAYKGIQSESEIQGISPDEVDEFETCFDVKVALWSLQPRSHLSVDWDDYDIVESIVRRDEVAENASEYRAVLLRRPKDCNKESRNLNLLLYGDHCCYIKDVRSFCKTWECNACSRLFDHYSHFVRHCEDCRSGERTNLQFPGGAYGLPKTPPEELEELGFDVSKFRWFYPFFAVFDCESFQKKIKKRCFGGLLRKTVHKYKLSLASISVNSNVPGFAKAKFFLSKGKPRLLVLKFVAYLDEIQKRSSEVVRETFKDLLEEIDVAENAARSMSNKGSPLWVASRSYIARLERARERLVGWVDDLVVFSFNGGRFDINLLRKHLFPLIKSRNPRILKRGNAYLCVHYGNIKMQDICNHLAAGVSYDNWLKAYKIPIHKFHWPHDWFDSLKKLSQTFVPPIEAYYNKLKGIGLDTSEYLDILKTWKEQKMKTMRDMLKFYNNTDVTPFVLATKKMISWWETQGIDMLRDGISLPGLALRHLFTGVSDSEVFELPNEKNQDLFWLMKRNVVGGPSLVMHRYHEKNKTRIRGPNGKLCKKIIGFDANALYLHCLMQAKPTGIYHRWLPDDNKNSIFRRLKSTNVSSKELQWLAFQSRKLGSKILSRYNGRQQNFGTGAKTGKYKSLLVDGFDPIEGRVYEYLGCYWHGHLCKLNSDQRSERSITARRETKERLQYIEELGFKITTTWECEFDEQLTANPELALFVRNRFQIGNPNKRQMSDSELLKNVESGAFFGLVEVDIEVPDHLKEYFSELPPIFKNANVTRFDIGSFMRKYAEKQQIMRQPRRLLISSYHGKQLLLNTRLLQWYLVKGLLVTKIHQAFEFRPSVCFHEKGEIVAENRRAADIDPDKSVIAEMFKTTGNCYYGKTITTYCYYGNYSNMWSRPRIKMDINS